MNSIFGRDSLMPRPPDDIGPGLIIALVIHVGLVVAIAFGVNWRSREPEAFTAELWAAVPQTAAPRAVEPEPAPVPKPVETPPAPPPPPPPPPEPKPVPRVQEPPPPTPDAQIAIEREKLERERKELEAERQRQQELQRQREREKEKALQAEREKQKREEAERQRREEERKRLAEEKRRQEVAAQKKREAEEAERLAALREKNLDRMRGMADATGGARSTGTAMRDAAPSSGYAGRIKAKVRPNIVFFDDVPGNPVAEVEVRLAPDGTIVGTPRLLKSSGVPAWDDAVIRAVVKTEVLPRDIDGRVPPAMVISFRPNE